MTYTEAFKSKMVQRLLGPSAITQCELARQTGVPQGTLSHWVQAATVGDVKKNRKKRLAVVAKQAQSVSQPAAHSAEERLRLLAEASQLSDQELGEFLRREGL